MKKLFSFMFCFITLFALAIPIFSQTDTIVNGNNVVTQVGNVVAAQVGQNLSWKILFFAAIAGVLIRIVTSTIKGIKNKTNGSPLQFAFSYWIKDNILPKIATVLTFILTSNFIIKLPGGWLSYIIFGAIGLIAGYFLDYVYSLLKGLIPPTTK
jgi:hypothetical protein